VQLHRLWIQEFCAGAKESVLDFPAKASFISFVVVKSVSTINYEYDSERSEESLHLGPTIPVRLPANLYSYHSPTHLRSSP